MSIEKITRRYTCRDSHQHILTETPERHRAAKGSACVTDGCTQPWVWSWPEPGAAPKAAEAVSEVSDEERAQSERIRAQPWAQADLSRFGRDMP